jgi:exosortase
MPLMLPNLTPRARLLLAGASVPLLLLWVYWPTLVESERLWARNPQYSHGYLVPIFAAFLLWLRRDRLKTDTLAPSWWGLPLVILALVTYLGGTWFYQTPLERYSLLPCLAGLVLAVGGWKALRWALPSILFLFFMLEPPYYVATSLSAPLQTLATNASTFVLQTVGLPAVSEGNVIHINDQHIGIVEACNGLRMLLVFFALSTGMALVISAPLGDRIFLVVSSIPIALVANIARISITGVLGQFASSDTAHVFYHDVAGWLMPALALGIMWLELKMLSCLLIETPHAVKPKARERQRPVPVSAPRRQRPARPVATAPRPTRPSRRPAPVEPKSEPPQRTSA